MTKKTILFVVLGLIMSFLFVYFFGDTTSYYGAQQVYRVYLNGNSIAIIKNKEELENYIDKEQQELKEEYNVSKIYIPAGLEIKPELTYNEELVNTSNVYENIKDIEPFTVEGYEITIEGEETKEPGEDNSEEVINKKSDRKIYVLDKKVFEEAINNTILAFIDEEDYQAYLDEMQVEIEELEEGKYIENVYIKEKVKIQKTHIPVDKEIFMDSGTLAKYLLYGTVKEQNSYTVKMGETIEKIASQNKLNVREFLIANKDIKNADTLLYEGQKVFVDPVRPIFTLIVETKEASYQEKNYTTEIQEDPNFYVGYSKVVQSGVKGEEYVTRNVRMENGAVTEVINISNVETKTPIARIVKTGSRTQYIVGNTGLWAWPTRSGYMISTYYGHDNSLGYYRFHAAIDIAGLGCNSPIYAANDGTVKVAKWNNSLGYYIEINHNNGYTTLYAHLNAIYVSAGQAVEMGNVIGAMGSTGYSTGCHLHYGASFKEKTFNPLELYR